MKAEADDILQELLSDAEQKFQYERDTVINNVEI